jgi:hypothetical protein
MFRGNEDYIGACGSGVEMPRLRDDDRADSRAKLRGCVADSRVPNASAQLAQTRRSYRAVPIGLVVDTAELGETRKEIRNKVTATWDGLAVK